MPEAPFQPQLDFSPHNNLSLFSDHYLQEILRRTPAWRDMQTPAADFLTWLRGQYAKERDQLENYNESQLEDNWIKPILDRLGHVWEGQASIPGLSKNIKKPDFALFPDEAARQTAVPHQNTDKYTKDVLALLEAKKWNVNLSKKTGTQPRFDDQNPMYQIDTYLSLSGVARGIVSNGRFWRLVHKNSSRTLETYFEIDLLAALHAANDNAALAVATFFWAFFNQNAFRADGHGRIFLDEALSQSKAYAIALEADLRDNAYRSLEQLIIGFFAGDGRLDPQNADHRDKVYRNSLYLLYRLLFLFYGEARALLPMGNATYKDAYSLQTLAGDINRQRDRLDSLPSTGRRHWDRLQELFRLISGRDAQFNAELGVPRYNGGLFDPDQHRFLEDHFVGDRALAKAIDYLAYRRVREDGRFQGFQAVDYRTLDVRQLGSIYEGLLEYKVAVASEEMVTVRQKGVETWVPQAKKGRSKTVGTPRQPGELYLTTDKGERKATGSYYTPDYIVEYIVENTLGPLVEQARERVKEQIRQTGSLDEVERQRQSAALFVQEILALNVLDPAMGSGHFLVEAMNFLAIALATDEYASAQIGPFSENGPISDGSEETDLLYWKRRVVEACIYGVDKNPMAVELAKLSLWLKTAAADKPLSFLDHHLQHGDSLIGAWLDDLRAAPGSRPQGFSKGSSSSKTTGSKPLGSEKEADAKPLGSAEATQQPLFDETRFTRDINRAVADVLRIESLPTLDIDDVHAKEATWQQIRDTHVARWQKLADLWVSAYFGNVMTPEEYRALAAQLQGQESLLSEVQVNHFLQHPAVTDNDYFHWELAFPEVFFDEYGRHRRAAAGFDAVIGNPPYVRQEIMAKEIKEFYSDHFREVHHGVADIYVYFLGAGIEILRENGLLSYITSGQFQKLNYGAPLRQYLTSQTTLQLVVDFGTTQVFADALTYPIILLTEKREPQEDNDVLVIKEKSELSSSIKNDWGQTCALPKADAQWNFVSIGLEHIFHGWNDSQPLSEILSDEIYRGVTTGFNDAFVISKSTFEELVSEHSSTKEIVKPYVRGEDLYPWYQDDSGLFLIFTRRGTDIDRFPAVKKYLQQFRQKLEPRPADWDKSKTWPGRKPGRYEWFEIQDSVDYFLAFENPRIHSTKVSLFPSFSICDQTKYAANTSYVLPINNLQRGNYLLSILNSKLFEFYSRRVFAPKANGYYEVQPGKLAEFPIPTVDFSTQDLTAVVNTAKTHYAQGNTAALLAWTDAELAANRNDTIHDLLAHLAGQMITLNQQKQAALEAFWLDLEGVTDPNAFDTLRNKGKWEQSLHKNVPATRAFVDESSRSTITLDATLGWNEDAFKGMVKELVGSVSGLSKLVQVYRDHAPSITALNQRLTTTDHLIDQIVYKLYNLTPEEIAIVEGAT